MEPGVEKVHVRRRLRYHLDNTLLRGSMPLLALLGVTTVLIVAIFALVVWVSGWGPLDQRTSLPESIWLAVTRSLDPGTFGQDQGAHFRFLALVVTLAGVLFLATIIALVTTGIDRRLEELRRGHSPVVESEHQLILGWSAKVPRIVGELSVANESRTRRRIANILHRRHQPSIVVLTPRRPADVEHDIRSEVRDLLGTRLIVRNGDPASHVDLELVRPGHARSIIVVSPDAPNPDAHVVRAVVALNRYLGPGATQPAVVVEVQERGLGESLTAGVSLPIVLVLPDVVIAKITGQVVRTPGLSAIYGDLLDFAGNEFYTCAASGLDGTPFDAVRTAMPKACPVGLVHPDGTVVINPAGCTPLHEGDKIVALAEDDRPDDLRIAPERVGRGGPTIPRPSTRSIPTTPETTLVIGWNHVTPQILAQLERDSANGSQVDVFIDDHRIPADDVRLDGLRAGSTRVYFGDTACPKALESRLRDVPYDHVLIVCNRDHMAREEAEAHTLLTLLHVRQILDGLGLKANIVTELLQVQDECLAEVAHPDDFIVSDRLVSLLVAQVSEEPSLASVFEDLFDADGTDVLLRPLAEVGVTAGEIAFDQVTLEAAKREETAIGWRLRTPDRGTTVELNPDRQKPRAAESVEAVILLSH